MSQPRVISSGDTLFAKVGIPALLLVGLALAWHFGRRPPVDLWATIPVLVGGLKLIWMSSVSIRLKRVAMSDTSLHVSNFLHEIVVPLREVDRVSERLRPLHSVVLELAQDTRFGRRIEFSSIGFWPTPPPQPIVIELQNAVAAAKQSNALSRRGRPSTG